MPREDRGKKRDPQPAEDYYKLKTQAVDDLIHANRENSPQVPPEELRKYTRRGLSVPEWGKALFVKFWFPASVCFFFLWGLGTYLNLLDLLFDTALALGVVTDLLTNNVLRFLAPTVGANDRWMMYPKKRYITLFQNILHAFVVLFLVYTIYNVINAAVLALSGAGAEGEIPLGVEPILFGVFYMLCDTALVEMKHLCVRILRDAKNETVSYRRESHVDPGTEKHQ